MSTSAIQSSYASSWKQEVSRRVAAHQSRGGLSAAKTAAPAQSRPRAGSRAAQAAARVAAHYAQAPSYSQMLAMEALAAQSAGQAVQAALETPGRCAPELWQAAAFDQSSAPDSEPASVPVCPVAPGSSATGEGEYSRLDWQPDLYPRPAEEVRARASRPVEGFAPPFEEDGRGSAPTEAPSSAHSIELVEPDLPIPANLIEFPRELVATRRKRPRRAEGPFAEVGLKRQLSIFEVDPDALSVQPEEPSAAPAWTSPEWSNVELEAQPRDESEVQDARVSLLALQQAPTGRRLTAALVDGALVAGAFLGAVLVAAARIGHPLPARIEEIGAVSALLFAGLLYETLFLTLAEATPGMKCAGVCLCTFEGQRPTRAQLRRRLGALLLSLFPLGLGIVWILFDDDHLCWHDRLSRTYLRKC